MWKIGRPTLCTAITPETANKSRGSGRPYVPLITRREHGCYSLSPAHVVCLLAALRSSWVCSRTNIFFAKLFNVPREKWKKYSGLTRVFQSFVVDYFCGYDYVYAHFQ